MTPAMTHASDCSRPQPNSKRVNAGWMRLTCPECAHVGSAAAPAPDTNVSPERERRPIGSGYRCRDHHEQPVTPKGRGCPLCTRAKRKAPQARDDEETYR